MAQLIGKYYTWGNVSIFFDRNGILCTPWSMGTYLWLDDYTVTATWAGLTHKLTFNKTFTEFESVRESDAAKLTGHTLVPHAYGSSIPSIKIDYKNSVSELCLLGKRYNVDKSSQREAPGPNDSNHCHPYSLLYSALFREARYSSMNFAEIGIAEGRSLLMWQEYLPNSKIYGYEKYEKWLHNWAANYSDKERIQVNSMDVRFDSEIIGPLKASGVLYDCILDDSSHFFYDMVRIVKCATQFLKPGGMIIIEDIRRSYDEAWFYNELAPILDQFQKVFFIDLDHARRNSGVVQNDKVLVLIKHGATAFNFNLI